VLTPRENFLETIKTDGKPDRLVNQWEPIVVARPEPTLTYLRKGIERGKTAVDPWGVTFHWPEDQPAAAPWHTPERIVIKEITAWKKSVKMPDFMSNCTDWAEAEKIADSIDRNQYLVGAALSFGLFERAHGLMGFEDTLVNMLLEPEAFGELLDLLLEERMILTEMKIDHLKPDIMISHDDWGTKTSLFMSPDTWRDLFKPRYKKLYDYMHSRGVIVLHHADCYLEPIVAEMAEIGVDVWQGALMTNNIPALQEQLAGRLTLMGGMDTAALDRPAPENEIRAATRASCALYGPGGHFIPGNTYGAPNSMIHPEVEAIVSDAIAEYNEDVYGIRA
jgi:hypothetical protein